MIAIMRPFWPCPSTNFSTSALGVTPPVGLAGELMMISRVLLGDQAQRFLGGKGKAIFLADRDRHRALRRYIRSWSDRWGKPGSGYMISTPGSPNIRMDMNMVGLPPGMIITSSGDTVTP